MSQLTAGIEILIDAWGEAILVGMEEEASSCSVAIMILKAAEGVDKERTIRALASLLKFYVENSDHDLDNELEAALAIKILIELRTLIETLPDPKPEEPK